MPVFTTKHKVREVYPVLSKEDFLKWRARVRKSSASHGNADLRLPIFGAARMIDPEFCHDDLKAKEDFAAFIKKWSYNGIIAVRQTYTDCDGYSGEWWHVIPATYVHWKGLELSCDEGSDGTYGLSVVRPKVAMRNAPQWVKDRLILG